MHCTSFVQLDALLQHLPEKTSFLLCSEARSCSLFARQGGHVWIVCSMRGVELALRLLIRLSPGRLRALRCSRVYVTVALTLPERLSGRKWDRNEGLPEGLSMLCPFVGWARSTALWLPERRSFLNRSRAEYGKNSLRSLHPSQSGAVT